VNVALSRTDASSEARVSAFAAAATEVEFEQIRPWRDSYREEMRCQIIHDSIHVRPGWTREFMLRVGDTPAGYGSLAVAGPWRERPTLYEFSVLPQHRSRVFDLFDALRLASGAVAIETQTNGVGLLSVMLHAYARDVISEKILFADAFRTALAPPGATFRPADEKDAAQFKTYELDDDGQWVVELDGMAVAAGDVLYHYNRPYGDIYMKVAEPFRKRGLGSFLVQELKRVCYEQGSVPAARCNPQNAASRQTLQRAGFVPCGHILIGSIGGQA
jgi:GNAT superfamily N-acetyltransferase